jgi:hypothetical protein
MFERKNGVFRVTVHRGCIVMLSFSKESIFVLRDLFHVELSARLVNTCLLLLNVNIQTSL